MSTKIWPQEGRLVQQAIFCASVCAMDFTILVNLERISKRSLAPETLPTLSILQAAKRTVGICTCYWAVAQEEHLVHGADIWKHKGADMQKSAKDGSLGGEVSTRRKTLKQTVLQTVLASRALLGLEYCRVESQRFQRTKYSHNYKPKSVFFPITSIMESI